MKTRGSSHVLDYGQGALIIIVASVGFAAVVYGLNLVSFNILNLPAWVFCPLGAYTLVYSLFAHKEHIYYAVWGFVMLAVGLISASYNIISPLLVLGILLIIIAVIGLIAYMRSKS
ncbi:MAG: hypothetical protein QXZ06_08660 [Candidatus Jordarchaeales archaeon]